MSGTHGGVRSAWPTPWAPPASAGRVPEPTEAAMAAAPALLALLVQLGDRDAPCTDDERWTSDTDADVAAAVEGCAACPALQECRAYAESLRPVAGVWAGQRWTSTAQARHGHVTTTSNTNRRERASA